MYNTSVTPCAAWQLYLDSAHLGNIESRYHIAERLREYIRGGGRKVLATLCCYHGVNKGLR